MRNPTFIKARGALRSRRLIRKAEYMTASLIMLVYLCIQALQNGRSAIYEVALSITGGNQNICANGKLS